MSTSPYILQRFVSAKEPEHEGFTSLSKTKTVHEQGSMSGEEARTFYEVVLSSSSSDAQGVLAVEDYKHPRNKVNGSSKKSTYSTPTVNDLNTNMKGCASNSSFIPRKSRVTTSDHRLVNDFLKNAQEGNLKRVQELLSNKSVDINVCDQFSWTGLMCASQNGQIHIVKYLLERGALWRSYKDSQGRTALDLAKIAQHFDIAELLRSFRGLHKCRHKKSSCGEHANSIKQTKFWCSVCEQEFTDQKGIHEGSMVHLFNIQRKPQKTFYYIPEGNVGYQLMLKSGWNEDQGLGPDGVGRKYPVRTVLKRDRLGFGNKGSQPARVTHFGPNDPSAVKRKKSITEKEKTQRTKKKTSRRDRVAKEKKEKNWERNMRIYMNTE